MGTHQIITPVKAVAVCSEGQWIASGLASGDVTVFDSR